MIVPLCVSAGEDAACTGAALMTKTEPATRAPDTGRITRRTGQPPTQTWLFPDRLGSSNFLCASISLACRERGGANRPAHAQELLLLPGQLMSFSRTTGQTGCYQYSAFTKYFDGDHPLGHR